MGLLLFRLWPALIPLLMYYIWHVSVCRKAEKNGQPKPKFRDGPWYWAVLASLAVGAACLLFLGASIEPQTGTYVPPHMENGVLVPGQVK